MTVPILLLIAAQGLTIVDITAPSTTPGTISAAELLGDTQYRLVVPDGATSLTITLVPTNSSADLAFAVRMDTPVEYSEGTGPIADDVVDEYYTGTESETYNNPPAGPLYIGIFNLDDFDNNYQLTVQIVGGQSPTFTPTRTWTPSPTVPFSPTATPTPSWTPIPTPPTATPTSTTSVLPTPSATPPGTKTWSAGTYSAPAGGSFDLVLRVNQAQAIAGGECQVSFNSSLLTAGAAQTDAITTDFSLKSNPQPGNIRIAFARATEAGQGTDVGLVRVPMTVSAGATGGQTSNITLLGSALFNETAIAFSVLAENGSLQVLSEGWPEDLNGDGSVNCFDLLQLIAAWRGIQPKSVGDVDKNGKVDYADAFRVAAAWQQGSGVLTPTPTSPPSTFTPTPTQTVTATQPTATFTPVSGVIPEQEDNGTPEKAQALGDLPVGSTIRVSGRGSSGGMQGGQYTGDLDYYSLRLPALAGTTLTLDWTGLADLDAGVAAYGVLLFSATGAEKPITVGGPLSEGTFLVLIASKNQAADYQLVLSAAPTVTKYENDNSLLSGRYQGPTSDPVFQKWFDFDGSGHYEYWNWNYYTGNVLQHSGSYSVWYPYLVLEHAGEEKVDLFDLDMTIGQQGFATFMYLDGEEWYRV